MVFEIRGFDSSDPERPVMVSLVSGDTPAIANIMYDDPTVVEPGELFWVFANKKAIQEDTDLTKSEFENEYGDCNFLTVRNLEVYKDPLEFSEGDIVEFKDGNCKFEVIGIDRNSRRLTYNLRVIATDKPITYGPADAQDLPFPKIEEIRKLTESSKIALRINEEVAKDISKLIRKMAERGYDYCSVGFDISYPVASLLMDQGYTVNGRIISW